MGVARDSCRHEVRNPGPVRVELRHVPEITAGDEPPARVPHHFGNARPGEGPGLEYEWPVAVAEEDEQRRSDGARRREQRDEGDAGSRQRSDEIGSRFADGECSNDRAHRQPPPLAKPGSCHFHRRRIDTGEARSGEKAGEEGAPIVGCDREPGIRDRSEQRRRGEEHTRGNDVGQVEERRASRSDHEPELDGGRQPADLGTGQSPARAELRCDCAPREPERHAEQFRGGEQSQGAPLAGAGRRRNSAVSCWR